MFKVFDLEHHETTFRQELLAGVVSFFSISYILFVNPMILSQAGVPTEYSVFSTILISAIGSFLMGVMANAPLVMAPGMGENAFFVFTLVAGLGLSWQQGLAAVVVSGLIFVVVAYMGIMERFSQAIPKEIKQAITVGIGLFLIVIGLENAGIYVEGQVMVNWIGIFGLIVTSVFLTHKVKGGFLFAILLTTIVYWIINFQSLEPVSYQIKELLNYPTLLRAPDYSNFFSLEFLLGVFSLTMLLIFETIGMIEALLTDEKRATKGYKAGAIAGFLSGLLGTSPAIPVAESGAGIQEGGKTGLTAVTAAGLFVLAIFFTPFLSYIPSVAVGPVIIITGGSMALNILKIKVDHWVDWIPLLLIMGLIPLTGSIVEGMAYGFIFYPVIRMLKKQTEEMNAVLWIISGLFVITLLTTYFVV